MLNSGYTFPVIFLYISLELDKSLGFFWNSIKEECFILNGNLFVLSLLQIVIANQASSMLSSVLKAWPKC